jgi:hypothetical protein
MIKKLGLTTLALSALLLSGCGGGGGKTDPMNDKNYIVILKNVPSGICESPEYRNILSEDLIGVLTEERSNTVSCGDYGKTNDQVECTIEYYSGVTGTVACVVGTDGPKYNKHAKVLEGSAYSNIIETKFIQISE